MQRRRRSVTCACTCVTEIGPFGNAPTVHKPLALSYAVPEALAAIVTGALAIGMHSMAKRNALIKRMPAVETLGSTTVICTDKTGTLTEGRMLVEKVWTVDGEAGVTGSGYEPSGEFLVDDQRMPIESDSPLESLLVAAALCNDAVLVAPAGPSDEWVVVGDPTEGALLALMGILLLLPGFITDTLGFLLLIPPLRKFLVVEFLKRSGTMTNVDVTIVREDRSSHRQIDVIEGEYSREDEERVQKNRD